MKRESLPKRPNGGGAESGYDLKRVAKKLVLPLASLITIAAYLTANARAAQSADKIDHLTTNPGVDANLQLPRADLDSLLGAGIQPLSLDPADLPQLFQIQINFNRPNRINDHTAAQIYWGHPWLAGIEVPGDPNSPFSIQWDGAMKWWIGLGTPPMDETHFWVQDNEGNIPGLVIFDATQDIDRDTSGCWPEGYAGPYKGPMFGVYFPVGATVPWGYAGNTTDFPLRALARDNDTNTDLDPIDINPNDAYSFPASWNFTVVFVNPANGQECGRFTYDLSWAEPVPTQTPSATQTETNVPPTATRTPTPSSTPTKTEAPTSTSVRPTVPTLTQPPTKTSTPTSPPPTKTSPPPSTPGETVFKLYLPLIRK